MTEERNIRFTSIMGFILACLICVLALSACGESAQASDGSSDDTSGDPFTAPAEIELSSFNAAAATGSNSASIDTSSASKGYVGAAATSSRAVLTRSPSCRTPADHAMSSSIPRA